MAARSKKPGKQRLSMYNAPAHIRRKFMTAKLSADLRAKLGIKRITIRKGDTVRIMRGEWAGHEGKVVAIDYKKIAIHVDGVTIRKADGTPVFYPIHPSNVMIIKLDLSDKKRKEIIERRKGRVVEEVAEEKKEEETKTEEAEVNKGESKSEGGE